VPLDERRRLAQKAFQHVALYDTAIARYLRGADEAFPDTMTIGLRKRSGLRYGENPHQQGAFYTLDGAEVEGLAAAEQLHGKELSYVNILDADAAYRAACDFDGPTAVVVKHATPCGLAAHRDIAVAWDRAFAGDPMSAFGGIVAFNRPVDETLAKAIRATRHPMSGARLMLDVIVAPDFTAEALALLGKSANLRILRAPPIDMRRPDIEYRHVVGGILMQEADRPDENGLVMNVVSRRAPTKAEEADLRFAWRCVKHVKSNAVVLAKDSAMVGMGAGQTNRVQAVELALKAAGESSRGAV
jgi:phosphoribosylaminoimidazolecarboxamide formyltransferase/IMP cyclohydrolase